jgi:hypothetical protein
MLACFLAGWMAVSSSVLFKSKRHKIPIWIFPQNVAIESPKQTIYQKKNSQHQFQLISHFVSGHVVNGKSFNP